MVEKDKINVVTKAAQVKERKTCPMCKKTVDYAGRIRCSVCNKLMLTDKEFDFQVKELKLPQSEQGRDDDLFERNEAKIRQMKEENNK